MNEDNEPGSGNGRKVTDGGGLSSKYEKVKAAAEEVGTKARPDQVDEDQVPDELQGDVTPEEFVADLADRLGLELSEDELAEITEEMDQTIDRIRSAVVGNKPLEQSETPEGDMSRQKGHDPNSLDIEALVQFVAEQLDVSPEVARETLTDLNAGLYSASQKAEEPIDPEQLADGILEKAELRRKELVDEAARDDKGGRKFQYYDRDNEVTDDHGRRKPGGDPDPHVLAEGLEDALEDAGEYPGADADDEGTDDGEVDPRIDDVAGDPEEGW